MNNFESRARAAGRAARDTVDDIPAVDGAAPHKGMPRRRPGGPVRALTIAAAVVLVAVAGTAVIATNRSGRPAGLAF